MGGTNYTVAYGGSDNSGTIATNLAAAISAGTLANASATGGAITVTAKTSGPGHDYSLAVGYTWNTSQFPNPSFTASSSGALSGGYNAGDPANRPFVTQYSYDGLGNLLNVTQKGDPTATNSSQWRVRTFTYDTLSRLLTAANPESGTIGYSYDANSNLIAKTDARGITINYSPSDSPIDALGRVTKKTYSNGDPSVTFSYDVAPSNAPGAMANLVGRLVSSSTGNTSTIETYDVMGRITTEWQCTPYNCGNSWFRQDYTYNLAGELTSHGFNGGFTISQAYDSAGRLTQVTGLSDAQHPGTLASVDPTVGYYAGGQLRKITLGNGLTETSAFNNRLQPCRMDVNSTGTALATCGDALPTGSVVNFSYGYGTGARNNGNVVTFSSTGAQSFNRTYAHDSIDRLTAMSAPGDTCSGLAWQYDSWGNRLAQSNTGGTCNTFQSSVTVQNQLAGYGYDQAGNMISDGTHTYAYDGEGRLSKIDGGNTAAYVYDAGGQRVQKITPSAQTNYWLDLEGHTSVEWNQNGVWMIDYIYVNGVLLGQYEAGTTMFVHRDHLGSTRLISALNQSVSDSMDYLPYGEQIAGGTGSTHKFTGKERDAESGLDYFGARYYSNGLGRFITPDWSKTPSPVPYADFVDPQTLNQYSYVRNLPTTKVDADGHCTIRGKEYGFWFCLGHALGLTETSYERVKRIEGERSFLLSHLTHADGSPLSDAERGKLLRLNQAQVDKLYNDKKQEAETREIDNELRRSMGLPPVAVPGSQSTGRTQPNDLREQLAMEQAQSNPQAGQQIQNIQMKDPRWPASQGWVKMRQNINGVEIHYVRNTVTGAVDDFKFAAP
jgi:RHS repeat-associated protein